MKKEWLWPIKRKKLLLLFSVAVIAALLLTAFPIHIERGQPNGAFQLGVGEYTVIIGNLASAADTADYTCDGTDDDETFQTAIDALPASGGQLFVLAGTYNWGATDTVTRAIDNISIVGIGAAVLFDSADSSPIFEAGGNDWYFAHFETDDGGLTMGVTTNWLWVNIKVDTTKYTLRTADISIVDGDFDLGSSSTTLAEASAGDVNIEGNIIYRGGGTDVPVTDGGTGASSASSARTNLGVAIGSDVQAWDTELDDIAALADTDSNFIVGSAGGWVAESGTTVRTSLELGTGNTPQFTGVEVGHATDTSLTRVSAGDLNVEGNIIYRAGGTDVTVTDGGTGSSTAGGARTNLGLVIGTDVQAYDAQLADIAGLAVTDGNIIVGDGANWVAESGATVRTSLGLTIGTDVAAQTHASQHAVSGADTVFPADPNADRILQWDDDPGELVWIEAGSGSVDTSGTPVALDYARFTDADTIEGREYSEVRTDLGLVIGTNVQAWDTELDDIAALADTDSNFIVGSAGGWVAESGATVRTSLGLSIGSDVQAWDTELDDIAALSDADSNFIVGSAGGWVAESGATVRASLGLVIGTDVLAQQTIGIADDNLLEVDDADAADNDFAKFTANGLEGREGSEVLGDLSGTAAATFDWNGQTLADWGIESGSTLDASPVTGQFFLHMPTGRNILYQYDGSNWVSIMSFGAMTVYVDATDGTDALTDHGHGVDGDAFATVQYAVDAIPPCFSGDVTININDEDYDETVTIRGKSPTGDYTITLQGTLAQQASATADSKVQGTGATQGSLTDTGAFGSYDNMLIEITNDDEYRVIDSDTADVVTICGTFSDAVDLAYIIWDWDTSINNIIIESAQTSVEVYDVLFDTGIGIQVNALGGADFYRCKTTTGYSFISGTAIFSLCYLTEDTARVVYVQNGYVSISRSKLYLQADNRAGIYGYGVSNVNVSSGTVIDSASTTGTDGIQVFQNTACNCYSSAETGYVRIRNCDDGIHAYASGVVVSTSNIQYSGCTTTENAVAASYGYID